MEKHFDLKVEGCRQNLFNVLNSSGLPMSVLNMLINELQQVVNSQYTQHLASLRKAEEEMLQENQNQDAQ